MPDPFQARTRDNNRADTDKRVDRKRPPDHTTEHKRTAGWLIELRSPPCRLPQVAFPLSVVRLSLTLPCFAPLPASVAPRPSRLAVAPETRFPSRSSRRRFRITG